MSGIIRSREELRDVVRVIEEDYRAEEPPFDEIRLPEWDVRDVFQGSKEDYANYLTLTAAVDYMKETAGKDGLWNVMHELYQDSPWVFRPTKVSSRGKSNLEERLDDISLLWGKQDLNIWYTICETLAADFDGSTKTFLEAQEYDALNLRQYMRSNERQFPYIKGDKINPLWLRLMYEEVHELNRIEHVDIPVDVRIIDITNEFMGSEYTDCKTDKYEIRTFWGEFCREFGFVPVRIDQPLWLLSKYWDEAGEQYISDILNSVRE